MLHYAYPPLFCNEQYILILFILSKCLVTTHSKYQRKAELFNLGRTTNQGEGKFEFNLVTIHSKINIVLQLVYSRGVG